MIAKVYIYITIVLLYSNLLAQPNYDARMLGLSGAYTTLARGYQCIGINPANLGSYNNKSANILNLSMGLSTNSLSISNYNAINGANLEDPLASYTKADLYESFGGEGIRMMQSLQLPLPMLNFSMHRIALSSHLITYIDIGMPNGFVDLLLNGNSIGKNIFMDMEQFILIAEEMGFSYGHSFNNFSIGFTLKYILGLFYMGMESIERPYITTNITGFTGENQYLMQQAIGGSGTGLDLGFTTRESEVGYRFGMSIINLLGSVKWTQDNFIRQTLEPSLIGSDFYLRPNEFMYVNMIMDNVTGLSFSDKSGDPMIYYEMYNVIPIESIEFITMTGQDSTLLVQLSDSTYLFPSGGKYKLKDLFPGTGTNEFVINDNYVKLSTAGNNPFQTRQPMYLRMGFSKMWAGQASVATDLVTGFSDRFGSSSIWKLSMGTEITRFKNKYFRFGYAFGGLAKKSMSIGYGRKIGNLYWDFGISVNGGFTIETAKGIDFAFGLTWQKSIAKN